MSWHKLLVRSSSSSAFNQSSISNLFTSRAFSLLTYQPGTKGAEQIWKEWREIVKLFETCKSSFSLCQTGAWGSRGWDGAIGNLFHQRGIMCRESTVLHNTQYGTFSSIEAVEKSRAGVDNVYRIPLRVHWYYFKGKLYPMWPCRLQPAGWQSVIPTTDTNHLESHPIDPKKLDAS